MAMNENCESILPDDEELLRQFLVAELAPSDPETTSDSELEELLEGLPDEPFPEDRLESLLKKVDVLLREVSPEPPPVVAAPEEASDRAAAPPSSSPVLGFLGNLPHSLGSISSFTPTFWALLILFSGMVFTGVVVMVVAIRGIRVEVNQPEVARQKDEGGRMKDEELTADRPPAFHPSSLIPHPSSAVARLVHAKDCHWSGQTPSPEVGDPLRAGQPLNLASGVAEIQFDIGAKVIVQSPAAFELLSANSARLEMGKATVEIQNERARGFKILTPEATILDQGTEFGVEVAPGGSSKVHVFEGLVDIDRKARKGHDAPLTQRLAANVGARMESGEEGMTLVEDTGECFIRSMGEADRDRHTVAYWRFEDRTIGQFLSDTGRNVRQLRATVDSSYNGNDLYAFLPSSQPRISGDVPVSTVPQTGALNRGCLDNSRPPDGGMNTRDVYTHSAFSHAAPLTSRRSRQPNGRSRLRSSRRACGAVARRSSSATQPCIGRTSVSPCSRRRD